MFEHILLGKGKKDPPKKGDPFPELSCYYLKPECRIPLLFEIKKLHRLQ